ncbi:MAG: hypothetical protein V2A79_18825 [Planctomycetota bacterium]
MKTSSLERGGPLRVAVVAWSVLTGLTSAQVQTPRVLPGSLAAFAPADCGLFVQIERPESINPELRDVNAWKLLQLLLGGELGGPDDAPDWYDVLVANLAGESAEAMRELFSERAALVAPTWTQLSHSVLLIQVPSRAALRRLVGPGMVENETQQDGLSLYETTRGLRLATDGRTVLIAQQDAPAEWFSRCLELLQGKGRESLLNDAQFAARVRELPKLTPQGFFYFATGARPTTTAPASPPATAPASEVADAPAFGPTTAPAPEPEPPTPFFWPEWRAGVVAMYAQSHRVDFLLRASPAAPGERTRPRVDMQWLKRLPRSTLVVWATALELDAALERLMRAPPDSALGSSAAFLTEVLDVDRLRREVVSQIGPRVVFVWGHDFLAEEGGSSLGLLFESADAEGVKHALDVALEEWADALNAERAAEDENGLRITAKEIAGADVTIVELADYLKAEPPTSAALRLASTLRPCYTALDGWLLMACNADHLRELISAHQGGQPVLEEFADVARLRLLPRGPTVLGMGQLATAAAVLGEWLDKAEKQPNSILNLYARGPEGESGHGRWLGLGLAPQTRAGRVPVAKVYEDGPCAGLVEGGDDLVALDSTVLDLEDASEDLRRRVRELADGEVVTLRLERAGVLTDVEVFVERPVDPREELVADVVRALRRLQGLSRHLAFATVAVTPQGVGSYQAHVRLRFTENP